MRVAVAQGSAGADVAENLRLVERLTGQAGLSGADLVILPESIMHDTGDEDFDLRTVAQPLDGPFVATLGRVARRHGVTVIAGMAERSPDDPDLVHNTVVAVDSNGVLQASYRKLHMYDAWGMAESARFTPGSQRPPVVDVAGVKVGVMTCYDLRFPEVGRALADAGAQLVAVPAAWFRGPFKEEHWTVLLRARAIEDTVYVAGAGQCGTRYVGRSMVVDPMGVVVSALGEDEGVAMAQIDVRRLGRVRAGNPVLKQRRFRVVADWEDRVAASAGASDPDAAADVVDSDVQVIATHR